MTREHKRAESHSRAYTVRAEAKASETSNGRTIVLEVDKEIRVELTLLPVSNPQTITVRRNHTGWWKPRTPPWAAL